MTEEDVVIGHDYRFASGMVRRVIAITEPKPGYKRVRLENQNGKQPGHRQWESLLYFLDAALPNQQCGEKA